MKSEITFERICKLPQWAQQYIDELQLGDEICGMLRDTAKRVTGGNCTFADGDLNILAELAKRGIAAGLTEGLHPTVLHNIATRAEDSPTSM